MYPKLTKAIHLLADSTDVELLPEQHWLWPTTDEGVNCETIEKSLEGLDDIQMDCAVSGDYGYGGEMNHAEWCLANGLEQFDWFMNEVFEGNYHNNFCKPFRVR